MRPQRNKLAIPGIGAAAGNFLFNFAAAVFWLFRWLGRSVLGGLRRIFVGSNAKNKMEGA